MNKRLKLILLLCLCIAIEALMFTLLHETGHAIVMLSAGAVIDEFSILEVHVSSHGGDFTNVLELWLDANGEMLPFLFSLVFLLFYSRTTKSAFYRLFSFYVGLFPGLSLTSWVIYPLLYMSGSVQKDDDITKFLDVFTKYTSPIIVSVAGIALIGIIVLIMIQKHVVRNYIDAMKCF